MKARSRRLLLSSAARLLLGLLGGVGVGVLAVSVLHAAWPSLSARVVGVLDVAVLLAALLPILLVVVIRPLAAAIVQHERDERARRAAESELRATLDSTADGILAVDDEGRVLHTNRRFAELWCIPPAMLERTGDRALLNFVVDQLADPEAFLAKVTMLYGSDAEDADVIRFKDGRTFERHSVPMRMEGARIGRVWSFRDISERQRANEHLSEQERQYRTLFDAHPEPMWVYDRETLRFLAVNDAAVSRYGWSREEFVAMTIEDVRPPEDVPALRLFIDRLAGGIAESGDWRHRLRDGHIIRVEIGSHPLTFQGRAARLVVARDVTARRHAEQSVRRADALRKIASRATRLGGWAVELTNLQVVLSDEMRDLLGAPADSGATVDDSIHTYCAEEWRDIVQAHFRRCREHGVPFDIEVEMVSRIGTRFWGRLVGEAERDDEGRIVRINGALQDITPRRQAEGEKRELEAQLQQSQKLESVGLLAGGVAHDFNNMLGVILGTVEMAVEELDASQPLHADLLEIRRAAQRSADLTRKLLAFARQQPVETRVLDLNETVPGMVTMLQRLIGEDIQLAWQPAAALWRVTMDPSQIDQILTNLCVNARHAISDVGVITIATANRVIDDAFCAVHADAMPGHYVRLTVQDTGCGMDAVTLSRIFEPFFTTKPRGEGTGLGLASVYGAVRQNDGFITVDSTPGQGTTFAIYLPRDTSWLAAVHRSGAVEAVGRGTETVLLVEDEPAMLRLVTRSLGGQGYTVLAADGPSAALRLAEEHPGDIHLLLTDVVMPAMNGRDLAAAIRKVRPGIRQLFMSGHAADVITHRGMLQHEVPFIQKPFVPGTLAVRVREVLDQHRASELAFSTQPVAT